MGIKIINKYPIFTDVDGSQLDNGYIYIGTSGLDPVTNPITVYKDKAMTTAVSQPIRTNSGYAVDAGVKINLYVNATDYSVITKDKNSVQVMSSLSANTNEETYLDTVQTFTAGQAGAVTALTSGTNVSIDLDDSNNYSLTLAHNATLDNPSNVNVGQSGFITVTQDGTGSRTLAYGTYYVFASGTAPTLSTAASSVDVLAYYVKSATEIIISAVLDIS